MTATDALAASSSAAPHSTVPVDAVIERLNDPAVAASLVTLLDNAELLSTLVLGLGGFISRGELIMEAVAEGVNELKATGAVSRPGQLPSLSDLSSLAGQLTATAPVLESVLASPMVNPATIEVLGLLSEAATEGAARARTNDTRVAGVRAAFKLFSDPEVQRGMGMLVEIARALGRRM